MDQKGNHFYLLTSDGQVEIQLAEDGVVGLLFRESDVKSMLG